MKQQIYLYPQDDGIPTYLTQGGTREDLAAFGITLEEGLVLTFYDTDASEAGEPGRLVFEGTVHYDQAKQAWYTIPDPTSFRFELHNSEAGSSRSSPDQ